MHLIFASKVTLQHWKWETNSSYKEKLTEQGRFCPSPDRLWLSTEEAMCPLKNPAWSWLPEHPWRLLCRSLLRGPLRIQITHSEIYGMICLENVFEGTQMSILFSWLQNSDSTKSQAKFCLFSLSLSTKQPSPMYRHKSASQGQSLTTSWEVRGEKKPVSFHGWLCSI